MHGTYEDFIKILKTYKQEHILKHLNEENEEALINQVLDIDFEEIMELYKQTKDKKNINIDNIEPVSAINPEKIGKDVLLKYKSIGENTIKNGEFAIAIMAGGQGTRLRT